MVRELLSVALNNSGLVASEPNSCMCMVESSISISLFDRPEFASLLPICSPLFNGLR
jgi:hypothetical protein